ncbi:polysaccharide deacetylase family protein [Streptomyces sp. NBC_00091]|uniref:polysaccharide deacetylase family protein n=1 Tax=Streptomyces sp. NBC_00091 TaxID=2975648 RepID=UPI00224FC79B|nr:polysaccharide deacetylase family protein [Streptomyces sp. NBC_00091]MCX5380221.1 polysaccharide deacetylase family protein [Streptomyces sp. NBC_00091]MCX5380912.1 polysaccharide deacetylase family protein [Streptomyces sp. NBC_00091]
MLLRTAVFLGIAAASGLVTAGEGGPQGGSTAGAPAGAPGAAPGPAPGPAGAAGAPGLRPEGPPDKSYRLRPMTAEAPARPPVAKPAVRSRPILELPAEAAEGSSMVLTFDDGPDPRYTPAILDTLARYGVRAMFFVCGEMAAENRDLLRRMTTEGHVIGNHTWTHPLIPTLGRSALEAEIGRTSEVVQQAVGQAPQWFRAPYGAWNRAAFEIGADLGMEPLAWTVDTLDWKEPGTATIISRVLGGAAPGVIVLNHDAGGDRSQSVRALEAYLPQLLGRGYRMTLPTR